MNAQLNETPLRPESRAIELMGDHVVVTAEWFEANEKQVRHLTASLLAAEREAAELREDCARKDQLLDSGAQQLEATLADARHWRGEAERMNREINTPETISFIQGVLREAAHQRERWGTEDDGNKAPEDWLWLLGYLAGKSLHYYRLAVAYREIADTHPEGGGDRAFYGDKARLAHVKSVHHIITTAAACANWHLNATGRDARMRAGKPFAFQTEEEPEPIEGVKRRGNMVTAGT